MSDVNENEQQQNAGKEAKKIEAKYAQSYGLLVAAMGGEKNLVPFALEVDSIAEIVKNLFKEDREAAEKKLGEDLKGLLKLKVEFDKTILAEKAKFDKAVLAQKKNFSDAVGQAFAKVKNINKLMAEYAASMKEAVVPAGAEDKVVEEYEGKGEQITD